MLPDGFALRALVAQDAPALAEAFGRNRDHLAPWEPVRAEAFYTVAGQEQSVTRQLDLIGTGQLVGWVLWYDGAAVGRLALNHVVRSVLLNASVGYWVDHELQGRGLATGMVEHALDAALDLGLHRVEAGTMTHNLASQAVLRRCGFVQYGTAQRFLFLDGAWRDHHLFQRILHDRPIDGGLL